MLLCGVQVLSVPFNFHSTSVSQPPMDLQVGSIEVPFIPFSSFFAVPSMDYGTVVPTILSFGGCQTEMCAEITIVNDVIPEMNESFFVTIRRSPGLDDRISIDSVNGEILIVDDDGMYKACLIQIDMYSLLQTLW